MRAELARAVRRPGGRASRSAAVGVLSFLVVPAAGCLVGPDYRSPSVPVADAWQRGADPKIITTSSAPDRWWQVFDDPVLDALVDEAYQQNLSLQAAGLRVIGAQARRGIAIGGLYPQTQELFALYTRTHSSDGQVATEGVGEFNTYQAGFDASWELDFWGKFRRAIEAADAELLSAVANYDDVLVSLIGEVAATYVRIRVLEEQLSLARSNARIQRESLEVARTRFEAGGTSELDVQQASTLLEATEADIFEFEIDLSRAQNSLSVLLGIPPTSLPDVLSDSRGIPAPPPNVMVAIPAELLHRRPDLVRAEQELAAQSARIGIAKSDLFPQIRLAGSVGLSADQAAKLFQGRSFEAMGGPELNWPVLNYGRLINAVRFEDATFQQLVAAYGDTVLVAQREVEDAIVGYLRGSYEVAHLERAVDAANRAVDISLIQYRGGATDYTSVLTAQQAKISADQRLTSIRGAVTLSVVALYKALGGGWELRTTEDFVPKPVKEEMRERTWWGDMLDHEEQIEDVDAARSDLEAGEESDGGRWRWWWPQW